MLDVLLPDDAESSLLPAGPLVDPCRPDPDFGALHSPLSVAPGDETEFLRLGLGPDRFGRVRRCAWHLVLHRASRVVSPHRASRVVSPHGASRVVSPHGRPGTAHAPDDAWDMELWTHLYRVVPEYRRSRLVLLERAVAGDRRAVLRARLELADRVTLL